MAKLSGAEAIPARNEEPNTRAVGPNLHQFIFETLLKETTGSRRSLRERL